MRTFKNYITEDISAKTRKETKLLVDEVYSRYIDEHDKNTVECVGWLDGHENALLRFQKIYEAGIDDNDSVLDVGCGVAHFYTYLKRDKEWNGKYLGIDPNKKAIDLIDEGISAMHGTIEDLDNWGEWNKFDWVIANGVFNVGLREENTLWIIENMISHANKGIIFNMLRAPYEDDRYEAYNPNWINHKLQEYNYREIKIVESFLDAQTEFTVYFYK